MPYTGNIPTLPIVEPSINPNLPDTQDLTNGFDGKVTPLTKVPQDNPYADSGSGNSSQNEQSSEGDHSSNSSQNEQKADDVESLYQQLLDRLNALNTSSISPNLDKMKELYDLLYAAEDLFHLHDLDKSVRQNFAEKIYDCAYNLALQQYNNMFSINSWIVQQSYNSPVEQLRRLNAAGLGGMYSSVQSNMAQDAPASDSGTASQNTGSGQLAQQAKQNKWQNAIGMLQTGVSMATSLVDGYSKLAKLPSEISQIGASTMLATEEANRIHQLAPQEFLNLCRARDVMDSQIRLNEENTATAFAHRNIIVPAMKDQMENKVAQDWKSLELQEHMFNQRLSWEKEFGRSQIGAQLQGQQLAYEAAMAGEVSEDFYVDSETGQKTDISAMTGAINADGSFTSNGKTYYKKTQSYRQTYADGLKSARSAKTPAQMAKNVQDLVREKRDAPRRFASRFGSFVFNGCKRLIGLSHPY